MPRNDFNGDGYSDILWVDHNRVFSDWLGTETGGFIVNDANAITTMPSLSEFGEVLIFDTGDFNGDGRDDILIDTEIGHYFVWFGDADGGFTMDDGLYARDGLHHLFLNAVGDFNGDGRDDLLWRNPTEGGQIGNWLSDADGDFILNNIAFPTASFDWMVAGIGDFNNDSYDDLLWRSDSGFVSTWLGQANGGFSVNDANALVHVPLDWQIAGVGDFNGDGRADILWRNDNGLLSNWLGTASGGFIINDANALVGVPTDWNVIGVGDYNGDGYDDILWRHTNGTISNWLGTETGGFIVNDVNAMVHVPTNWVVHPCETWV